jgi:hypothetical protein
MAGQPREWAIMPTMVNTAAVHEQKAVERGVNPWQGIGD